MEKDFGDSWCWLVQRFLQKKMVAPSFHLEGRRWGGCHCRKCIGINQQESMGKEAEEIQSRAAGSGTLVEQCFVTESLA